MSKRFRHRSRRARKPPIQKASPATALQPMAIDHPGDADGGDRCTATMFSTAFAIPNRCTRRPEEKQACRHALEGLRGGDLKSPPSAPAHVSVELNQRARKSRRAIGSRHPPGSSKISNWTVHQRERGEPLPSPVRAAGAKIRHLKASQQILRPRCQRSLVHRPQQRNMLTCAQPLNSSVRPTKPRLPFVHCRDQDSDSPARGTVLKSVRSKPSRTMQQ